MLQHNPSIFSFDENHISGVLKWFSSAMNYGFITCDTSGEEIFLHGNTLRSYGRRNIGPGCQVIGKFERDIKGARIIEVIDIGPDPAFEKTPDPRKVDQSSLETDFVPARVKWFDQAKGYGFVNLFSEDTDYFLHIAVLNKAGFAPLETGEAIGVVVGDDERENVVLRLRGWHN